MAVFCHMKKLPAHSFIHYSFIQHTHTHTHTLTHTHTQHFLCRQLQVRAGVDQRHGSYCSSQFNRGDQTSKYILVHYNLNGDSLVT